MASHRGYGQYGEELPEEDILQKLVPTLRSKFLSEFAAVNADKYDERDVERVREDDAWLRHFLLHQHHQIPDTLKMMDATLKWRKSFGLSDITEESISLSTRELGLVFFHNKNVSNNDIMYFCIKLNKKGDAVHNKNARMMIAYLLETYQRKKPLHKIVALLDMTDVGLTHVDIDLTKFLITCFTSHFPAMLEYLLVYDMPWIINAVWSVVKLMLSENEQKFVKFCKESTIQQYIEKGQLFPHMGGTDTYKYRYVPPLLDVSLDEEEDDDDGAFQDSEEVTGADEHEEQEASRPAPSSLPDIAQQVPAAETRPTVRKQVNFAPNDDVQEFTSPPLTPPPETGDASLSRSSSVESGGTSSPKPSSAYKITIVPTSELQFTRPGINQDAACSIKLTNDQSVALAYKVRTTDPKNYKVKQGRGMLSPGHSDVVHITLLAGQEIKRDKFLVLSTKLPSDNMTPSELTAFWKKVSKPQIHEHKLRCHEAALDLDTSVNQVMPEVPSLTNASYTSVKANKSVTQDHTAQIEDRLVVLENDLKQVMLFLKIGLSLLVLVIALLIIK